MLFSDENNYHHQQGGWVQSSGDSDLLTARPRFYAQPRNEKFFSGRFLWPEDDQNLPI